MSRFGALCLAALVLLGIFIGFAATAGNSIPALAGLSALAAAGLLWLAVGIDDMCHDRRAIDRLPRSNP